MTNEHEGASIPAPYHRGVSRQVVVDAAVALAQEGVAITTSAVAQRLHIKVPSLYHHVAGNDDLKELVIADVHERLAFQINTSRPWQEEIRNVARRQRDILKQFPGLISEIAQRPLPNDSAITSLENLASLLTGAGFSRRNALLMLGMIDLLVIGGSHDAQAPQIMFPAFDDVTGSDLGQGAKLINETPDRSDHLFDFSINSCIAAFEQLLNDEQEES